MNDSWQYLSIVKSNPNKIYLNDKFIAENLIRNINLSNIEIGDMTQAYIDEIKVYDFALPESQILKEYQYGIQGKINNILTSDVFSANDELICSVTPADPYSAGITKNSTKIKININSPPRVSNINIIPLEPNTTSTLSCYATVIDDLNLTLNIEYFWYNGSNLFSFRKYIC
ncbi:MAG: hypothetical protein KatS3mg002_1644 [Candidatus Woesearchaeota archaeon]|nr:MAG: hypothetical protein KatS3mg002_1644 [Candidatus Woesearchaeota archaeon]